MNAENLIFSVVSTLCVAVASSASLAQDDQTRPAGGAPGQLHPSKLAGGDRQFVERAAIGDMIEVEMGKLAQQKAASDQVKQFAARMVQDHTKSHEELKELAHSKEVALPPAPPKAKHEMDELSKLSGAEFDRHYVAHMVAEHRMTVAEFKKASESANDIEVKVFASKSLPVLQEHLTQAESINVSIKSVAR